MDFLHGDLAVGVIRRSLPNAMLMKLLRRYSYRLPDITTYKVHPHSLLKHNQQVTLTD